MNTSMNWIVEIDGERYELTPMLRFNNGVLQQALFSREKKEFLWRPVAVVKEDDSKAKDKTSISK